MSFRCRLPSTAHFQRHHEETIFPVAFIDPVGEIAEERHKLIVTIKLLNLNLGLNIIIMRRIGLLSDTHNFLDPAIFGHFEQCDEIWHAGDFGTAELADKLKAFRPLRGVYGNIDGYDIRSVYPEKLRWKCEEVNVFMTHIGGYPPKY